MTESDKFLEIRSGPWLTFFVISSFVCYCWAVSDCNYLNGVNQFDVKEDTSVGSVLANASVYSLGITNSINDPYTNLLNVTQVLPGSWQIFLQEPLDSETVQSVEFKFICKDTANTAEQQISIFLIISDVNEYAPQFLKPDATISIPETWKIGTSIFTIEVSDPDNVRASTQFTFSILNGDYGYFKLEQKQYSANIVVAKTLDYDTGPVAFTLNISALEDITDGKTNYTTLTIHVLDEDDLMPEFLNVTYTLSVPEGNYTGDTWFQTTPVLSARDGDLHINETIQFKIGESTQATYKKLFSVSENGSIGIDGYLHFGTYSILIVAYQKDNPSLRYTTTIVTITVTAVNDHTPILDQVQYRANVSEAAPLGTVVLIVTAQDEDLGDNSVLKFHLGSRANGIFSVDTSQHLGIIKLTSPLDREKNKTYTFEVWAEETLTSEHLNSTHCLVTVTVVDENDNAPYFTQSQYLFYVIRTRPKGYFVGQVSANDPDDDVNGQVTYKAQFLTQSSVFDFDSSNGTITLNRELRYSDTGFYDFVISATDNAVDTSKRRSAFTQVTVQILPDNISPPSFVNTPYVFNVSETATLGLVGQVTAYDVDGDVIHYSASKNDYFKVNSTNGEITLIKEVDLDSTTSPAQSIDLKVQAEDGEHTAEADVKIIFLYVNEFPPIFQQHGPFTVFENATQDKIIGKVFADDKDKGQDGSVKYSLVTTTTSDLFTIDATTGEIKLNCSQCLERDSYDIIVKATDGGVPPLYDTMSFILEVVKTEFQPPRFLEDVYHVLLLENQPAQTVLQLSAIDTDTPQSHLKYSSTGVSPPAAATFVEIFQNGTVYINSSIDAEVLDYFIVDVSVTDGQQADSAQIVFNITDINDNPPTLNTTSLVPVPVPENSKIGSFVAAVGAKDKDITNSGFTYFLTDGTDGKFNINVTSGVITLAQLLDRRQKSFYNMTVNVLDHGIPPALGSGNLMVEVTDSNTAPYFVDASQHNVLNYDFNVKEDLKIGELIGRLYALDPDVGSSGHLTFQLQSGDSSDTFLLEKDTGNLTLARSLNFETKERYNLIAVVSDDSYEPKSASVTVTINVENVEEAPQWPQSLSTVYITQSSICKNQQQQLQAFSQDVATVSSHGGSSVEYFLLNMTNEFFINQTTGLLRITITLPEGIYTLGLQACNRGSHMCSNTTLPILVKNEDIFAFCPTYYTVDVNETAEVNFIFLDLNTTKFDSSVKYNITSGNTDDKFGIGEKDGRLYVAHALDREATWSYTLLILAEDTNTQEVAEAQVIIRVLDAPDEVPEFSASAYQGEVSESQNSGSPVFVPLTNIQLLVTATDKDENSKVSYSIDPTSDTSKGSFKIDPVRGAVFLEQKVDYENIPVNFNKAYTFTVLAADGIFTSNATVTVHVRDENDNPPHFNEPEDLSINVTEGPTPVKEIATLGATDPDTNTRLVYSLNVIRPAVIVGATQFFTIDGSGKLRVIQELDREDEDKYILNITVSDGKFNTSKLVIVTVLDVNDNNPYFNQTFSMTVKEGNAGLGTNISVIAFDADIGVNADLNYIIVSGNVNNSFEFDTKYKNVLKTVASLDREILVHNGVADIILIIQAVDHGQPPKTGTGSVVVTVADVNDNPPQFSQNIYYASVPEDATNATVPLTPPLNVTNADSDDCKDYRFFLSNNSPFVVHENTGELFVKGKLNREITPSYKLSITAVDDCGKGLNSSAQIIITITDVDDEAPHFLQTVYNFNISENSSVYQSVGVVIAKDDDIIGSHQVTYKVIGSHMFHVDPLKGEIILTGDLSRETTTIYNFTVSACDDISQCGFVTVYVDVTDTGNKCPMWNMTSLNLSVNEEQTGTVGFISANDQENPTTVSYIFNDTAGMKLIEINNKSGEVTLHKQLKADRSDINNLSFTVYAEDNGQPPCVQPGTLVITVVGTNDNDPEICYQGKCNLTYTQVTIFDQSPAGTLVALVTTRDNDTGLDGEVTLNLTVKESGLQDLFTLVNKGIIYLKRQIILADLQKSGNVLSDNVDIILLAKDKGQVSRSASATINVKIVVAPTDVLHFSQQSYNLTVQENEKTGTYVGTVSVISSSSANVNYSISTPLGTVPFIINQSGAITTSLMLDRETARSYLFVVQATNRSQPTLPVSVLVKVTVEDVNEPPTFDKTNITVVATEETAPVDLVRLTASDDDDGTNGSITYHLLNASLYPNFAINQSTGVLTVTTKLDRETNSGYDLIIQAVDGGSPPLSAAVFIHVTVSDLNDQAPKFSQSVYEQNITKLEPPVKVIMVKASDADEGLNKKLIYSLDSQLLTFRIDPLTGEIETVSVPDADIYTFVVIATDQGYPQLNGTAEVIVRVTDNRTHIEPSLSLSTNDVRLFVGMIAGTQLPLKITTIDADTLKISVVNGTDIFKLENEKIVLSKDLAQEAMYVLNITATSTTGQSISKLLEIRVTGVKFSQQSYVAIVPENGNVRQVILDINSDAEDIGLPVIYSLTVPDSAFTIDSSTGVLWVLHALDREEFPVYMLNVSLSLDHSTLPTFSRRKRAVDTSQTFASVLVRVEDQNDNVPSFGSLGPEMFLSVPGSVNTSYLITTFRAFDPDEGFNGLIRYSIIDGDTGAFYLNPVTGELRVASLEKLKDQLSFTLTVDAVDRNGTGSNSSSLYIKISVVQDGYQFRLPTPLPLSILQDNSLTILSGLSRILGFNLSLDGLTQHEKSSDRADILLRAYVQPDVNTTKYLSASQIDEVVSKQQKEIDKLFKSFMKEPKAEDDSLNTTSIALIALAGIMFLVTFVAIIISCRLWRNQKSYEQKKEEVMNLRHRMEQQSNMDNLKDKRTSSDRNDNLEMTTLTEVPVSTVPVNPESQEQTINRHLRHVQQSLRPLASESVDSELARSLNSNSQASQQELSISNQTDVNEERMKTTSSPEVNVVERGEDNESRNEVNSLTSDDTYKSVKNENKQHDVAANGEDENRTEQQKLTQIIATTASLPMTQEDTNSSSHSRRGHGDGSLRQSSNGAVPNLYSNLPKNQDTGVNAIDSIVPPASPSNIFVLNEAFQLFQEDDEMTYF